MRPTIFGMITTKGSTQYTDVALRSFFATTKMRTGDRFILIDNDGSYQQFFPKPLERLNRARPCSFAENMNVVLEQALELKADAVLLNNDLLFTNGWREAVELADDCISSPLTNREVQYEVSVTIPKTGHVQGKYELPMRLSMTDVPGLEHIVALIGHAHSSQSVGALRVSAFPFCCVRIPYNVISKVGMFDQEYGAGGAEDYDYCLRAYLAGFYCEYSLRSYVLHFGGKSSWSGVETEEETKAREAQFFNRFESKWGSKLFRAVLREDRNIIPDEGLMEVVEKRDFKTMIERLKS